MALAITGIVLMIIASLLYYVTVQEIQQHKNIINKAHDIETMDIENIWKKICELDNDLSRTRLIAGNAAKQADEAIKKVNGISFGRYIPKHAAKGEDHE